MMIEMKERMTCLNSILADREAPFTLEYCQRWKNNCMLEAYQLVNPKKNCSPTIFYGAWYEDDDESVIHEWIAHPYHEDKLPMYKAMVEEVNRTEVSLEERLSYSIYHYDAARGSLEVVSV